ncbi:MAG: hypothetical protein RLO02_06825 [Roseitalea porphyridii]
MRSKSEGQAKAPIALSLRARYLLLASAIAVGTASLVGGANYYWIERLMLDRALVMLTAEAELIAPQVQNGYERLRYDTVTISHMPPVKGLARSLRNGGVDPYDGSTTAAWRERLHSVFTSVLERRGEYMQMRLIGIADDGLELVSTSQADGEIRLVPGTDLRRHGGDPYLRDALDLPPGSVQFSTDTQSRENGAARTRPPLIRAVTPVHDQSGRLFGFLVIDAHYGAMLRRALSTIRGQEEVYVVDNAGDYMARRGDGTISDLVLAADRAAGAPLPPVLDKALTLSRTGAAHFDDVGGRDMVISRTDLRFDENSIDRRITVAVAAPRELLLADADTTREHDVWLSLLMVAACTGLAFVVSGLTFRPLHEAVAAIQSYRARAFLTLTESMGDSLPG